MNNIMDKAGLTLLAVAGLIYLGIVIGASLTVTDSLIGLVVLIALAGCGLMFAQAVKDRLGNEEDDYYSKTVEK